MIFSVNVIDEARQSLLVKVVDKSQRYSSTTLSVVSWRDFLQHIHVVGESYFVNVYKTVMWVSLNLP